MPYETNSVNTFFPNGWNYLVNDPINTRYKNHNRVLVWNIGLTPENKRNRAKYGSTGINQIRGNRGLYFAAILGRFDAQVMKKRFHLGANKYSFSVVPAKLRKLVMLPRFNTFHNWHRSTSFSFFPNLKKSLAAEKFEPNELFRSPKNV